MLPEYKVLKANSWASESSTGVLKTFHTTFSVQGGHTVEDVGICLGQAFDKALKDKRGIKRYGHSSIPMDETLAEVSLDLSGRPHLVFNASIPKGKVGDFDLELAEEFFRAFANHLKATLHINLIYGENLHHIIEAIFKAVGRGIDQATMLDKRNTAIPSTKGTL